MNLYEFGFPVRGRWWESLPGHELLLRDPKGLASLGLKLRKSVKTGFRWHVTGDGYWIVLCLVYDSRWATAWPGNLSRKAENRIRCVAWWAWLGRILVRCYFESVEFIYPLLCCFWTRGMNLPVTSQPAALVVLYCPPSPTAIIYGISDDYSWKNM